MKYLVLYTITPVQSFITEARKALDLANGSRLLSQLAKIGVQLAVNRGAKMIFPKIDDSAEDLSLPNRFLVEFEGDASDLINEISARLRAELEGLSRAILDFLQKSEITAEFMQQVAHYFHYFGVYVPLDSEDSYAEAYRRVEQLSGAAKNVRLFGQLPESGRKCILNGEYNALVYGRTAAAYAGKHVTIRHRLLQPGEGLCAISALKRFWAVASGKKSSFPSIAEICLRRYIDSLNQEMLRAYKAMFDEFEEQLLFEENLRESYLNKQGIELTGGNVSLVREKLRDLKKTGSAEPSSYYAVVMLDGDSMGSWLSGAYTQDKIPLRKLHEKLANSFARFAEAVRSISNICDASLVYAGGDDLLAFVPVRRVTEYLLQLRQQFDAIMQEISELSGRPLTFSAGVAIAHYKYPLSSVLENARAAEQIAKSKSHKNSVTIRAIKNSGEINMATWQWGQDIENFDQLCRVVSGNAFSGALTGNLLQSLNALGLSAQRRTPTDLEIVDGIIACEIKRSAQRSLAEASVSEAKAKHQLAAIEDQLLALWKKQQNINEFEQRLMVINFFAREA